MQNSHSWRGLKAQLRCIRLPRQGSAQDGKLGMGKAPAVLAMEQADFQHSNAGWGVPLSQHSDLGGPSRRPSQAGGMGGCHGGKGGCQGPGMDGMGSPQNMGQAPGGMGGMMSPQAMQQGMGTPQNMGQAPMPKRGGANWKGRAAGRQGRLPDGSSSGPRSRMRRLRPGRRPAGPLRLRPGAAGPRQGRLQPRGGQRGGPGPRRAARPGAALQSGGRWQQTIGRPEVHARQLLRSDQDQTLPTDAPPAEWLNAHGPPYKTVLGDWSGQVAPQAKAMMMPQGMVGQMRSMQQSSQQQVRHGMQVLPRRCRYCPDSWIGDCMLTAGPQGQRAKQGSGGRAPGHWARTPEASVQAVGRQCLNVRSDGGGRRAGATKTVAEAVKSGTVPKAQSPTTFIHAGKSPSDFSYDSVAQPQFLSLPATPRPARSWKKKSASFMPAASFLRYNGVPLVVTYSMLSRVCLALARRAAAGASSVSRALPCAGRVCRGGPARAAMSGPAGPGALGREAAVAWVNAYGEAWRLQDTGRILALYTPEAHYVERPYDQERGTYKGHDGIRHYWETHVRAQERDIHFRQLEGDLVFDPEARVTVLQRGASWKTVRFLQIALLRFAADGRVRHFEEFGGKEGASRQGAGAYERFWRSAEASERLSAPQKLLNA
ncbi:unnamed protein product [Prorocentrum cordatum]|uniref:SnoaL-like domain-containing protein n=1 Tax=Prorocentrum cordatum TaxID=2364126 RepID=A0ABN9PZI4_9DINO|nr:unnamed protein product [Polarella glacialis]